MKQKRRNHSIGFKARVALEARRSEARGPEDLAMARRMDEINLRSLEFGARRMSWWPGRRVQ